MYLHQQKIRLNNTKNYFMCIRVYSRCLSFFSKKAQRIHKEAFLWNLILSLSKPWLEQLRSNIFMTKLELHSSILFKQISRFCNLFFSLSFFLEKCPACHSEKYFQFQFGLRSADCLTHLQNWISRRCKSFTHSFPSRHMHVCWLVLAKRFGYPANNWCGNFISCVRSSLRYVASTIEVIWYSFWWNSIMAYPMI